MVDEKRKTTVPIPPVGADGEQPILNTTTGIITGGEGEINSPGVISQENFLEFQRLYDRLNNPAYLHTVTLSELYETSYPSRPPIIIPRPLAKPWLRHWIRLVATLVTEYAAVASVPRWPMIAECAEMLSPHDRLLARVGSATSHISFSSCLEK